MQVEAVVHDRAVVQDRASVQDSVKDYILLIFSNMTKVNDLSICMNILVIVRSGSVS